MRHLLLSVLSTLLFSSSTIPSDDVGRGGLPLPGAGLRLEAGHTYLTGNGRLVRIISLQGRKPYTAEGLLQAAENRWWDHLSWATNGCFILLDTGGCSPGYWNLVGEVAEEKQKHRKKR